MAITIIKSLPSREAWIEIGACVWLASWRRSLPSREAWIEIAGTAAAAADRAGRFPRGKRGLKCDTSGEHVERDRVASPAGSVD